MDEMKTNPTVSGISELERIFQEYKKKLEDAESEANDITNAAWEKAEKLIADKQNEAEQISDDLIGKAKQEADRITREARNRADEIEREAASKARKEAKERTKKEIDVITANMKRMAEKEAAEIKEHAQREAAEIIRKENESARLQIFEEADTIVAEAKERARKVDEDAIARAEEMSKSVTGASRKACENFGRIIKEMQTELNDLATVINKTVDEFEISSILEKTATGGNDNKAKGTGKFKGWREIDIAPPYDTRQIKRLVDSLKQIPNIKFEGQSGTEENFSIFLDMAEPIPLQDILNNMSIVESSDVRGDKIAIQLKQVDDKPKS